MSNPLNIHPDYRYLIAGPKSQETMLRIVEIIGNRPISNSRAILIDIAKEFNLPGQLTAYNILLHLGLGDKVQLWGKLQEGAVAAYKHVGYEEFYNLYSNRNISHREIRRSLGLRRHVRIDRITEFFGIPDRCDTLAKERPFYGIEDLEVLRYILKTMDASAAAKLCGVKVPVINGLTPILLSQEME